MGASASTVAERLSTFTGYEHRLELCRREGELAFYNDSKATNPEATVTALKAMQQVAAAGTGGLTLILGGRDKLTTLAELVEWVQQVATHVVLIGEAADRFEDALRTAGYTALSRAGGLEEAVPAAVAALDGRGTILLSPACASFDQYGSYEERGEHFKRIVTSFEL